MRFLLVITIWIILVGGMYSYTSTRDNNRATQVLKQPEVTKATGEFSLLLTPTFTIEEDPFALTQEMSPDNSAELWVNGLRIELDADNLVRGEETVITPLSGMVTGANEIFIQASPPLGGAVQHYALRVQLVENDTSLVDQTFWGESGALVTGTLTVELKEDEGDDHDH